MIGAHRGVFRSAVLTSALLAATAMAAAPAAAQAASSSQPGATTGAPSATAMSGVAARRGVALAVAPPQPGVTPSVAATGTANPAASLFYVGSDSQVYMAPLPPGSARPTGGRLVGGPGSTFIPPGAIRSHQRYFFLVGRGTDNALWAFDAITPQGFPLWVSLGGRLTSRPGAAAGALSVPGGEALDLVARGSDGAVWDRESTSTAYRPWVNLGGQVLAGTGPAAVNTGGTLYVLAVGLDHALWVTHSTDGTHWSGWRSLGGRAGSDIGAATPAPGVARGADNAAWYNEFAGSTAGVSPGWHTLGGRLTAGVGAGSAPGGMTWAVTLGTDNRVWQASGMWPALRWSKAG